MPGEAAVARYSRANSIWRGGFCPLDQLLHDPVVQRAVVFKFQRTHESGSRPHWRPTVGWAKSYMGYTHHLCRRCGDAGRTSHTVNDRVPHVQVGGSSCRSWHAAPCCTVRELALRSCASNRSQVFLHGAVAVGALLARLGEGRRGRRCISSARQLANKGLALLDQARRRSQTASQSSRRRRTGGPH